MAMMTNKSKQMANGNAAEKQVVDIFRQHHYWVHDMAKSQSGSQPVDIVAIRGSSSSWLVDVKNVRKDEISFPFSRIDANQLSCMKYANEWALIPKQQLGFVVVFGRHPDSPVYLSYDSYLEMVRKEKKSANYEDMVDFSTYIK